MKVCTGCQKAKPACAFSPKGNALASRCRECLREYNRRYYKANYKRKQSYYAAKNRRNKARQRQRLKAILLSAKHVPCQDCGNRFHAWVMEFDHRDGEMKLANVGNLVGRGCTNERLFAEIAKCDVVCANCHRVRTFQRRQKVLNNESAIDIELQMLSE